MSNDKYEICLELTGIEGAILKDMQTTKGLVKCVIIPVGGSMKVNPRGRVYLYANVMPLRKESEYGDTHSIKRKLFKEEFLSMGKAELDAIPIIGNMRPKKQWNNDGQQEKDTSSQNVQGQSQQYERKEEATQTQSDKNVDVDDLPF